MRDNNTLQLDGDNLQNFVTKCILPTDTTADIMNTFSAGEEAFAKFATERLTGDISLWDRIKRLKLKKMEIHKKNVRNEASEKHCRTERKSITVCPLSFSSCFKTRHQHVGKYWSV